MNGFSELQGKEVFPPIIKMNVGDSSFDFNNNDVIIREYSERNIEQEREFYLYPGIKFIFKLV